MSVLRKIDHAAIVVGPASKTPALSSPAPPMTSETKTFSGKVTRESPTPTSVPIPSVPTNSNHTLGTQPRRKKGSIINPKVERQNPWEAIVRTAFSLLNATRPDLTAGSCLLCLSPNPPFFEAVGVMGHYNVSNASSPGSQCSWTPQFSRNRNQLRRTGFTMPLKGNFTCVRSAHGERTLGETNCSLVNPGKWAYPPEGSSWICIKGGWFPCLSLPALALANDTCAIASVIPRVMFRQTDEIVARKNA